MVWNIPSERAEERLEELYQYLDIFPNSKLESAIKEEIAILEKLLNRA